MNEDIAQARAALAVAVEEFESARRREPALLKRACIPCLRPLLPVCSRERTFVNFAERPGAAGGEWQLPGFPSGHRGRSECRRRALGGAA